MSRFHFSLSRHQGGRHNDIFFTITASQFFLCFSMQAAHAPMVHLITHCLPSLAKCSHGCKAYLRPFSSRSTVYTSKGITPSSYGRALNFLERWGIRRGWVQVRVLVGTVYYIVVKVFSCQKNKKNKKDFFFLLRIKIQNILNS